MAANMIGVHKTILAFDNNGAYMVMFNPKITKKTQPYMTREGCLSVPDVWGITHRPKKVTVRALNLNGEEITVTGEDLGARALCHELDHLDGHLFTDRAVHILTPEEVEAHFGKN